METQPNKTRPTLDLLELLLLRMNKIIFTFDICKIDNRCRPLTTEQGPAWCYPPAVLLVYIQSMRIKIKSTRYDLTCAAQQQHWIIPVWWAVNIRWLHRKPTENLFLFLKKCIDLKFGCFMYSLIQLNKLGIVYQNYQCCILYLIHWPWYGGQKLNFPSFWKIRNNVFVKWTFLRFILFW